MLTMKLKSYTGSSRRTRFLPRAVQFMWDL